MALTEAGRLEQQLAATKQRQAEEAARLHAETLNRQAEAAAAEAAKKKKANADAAAEAARQSQEEANRVLAERIAFSEAETARRQAKKEVAVASSSQTNKGIFIQLPGLDGLSEQVDASTTAQADRVIGRVESAEQSIINAITSSATANKPDLSVVTELKSIITTQNTKIDSLATLVNGQGVLLENLTTNVSELTERVDQLPSAPPSLSQNDRALLRSQADHLTSQGVLSIPWRRFSSNS